MDIQFRDIDEKTAELIAAASGHVNVIVSPGVAGDKELFFGPCEASDVFLFVPEGVTWAHVLAALGCFPSVTQARKNGWAKPIAEGFTPTFKVGKRARKFFTSLNTGE